MHSEQVETLLQYSTHPQADNRILKKDNQLLTTVGFCMLRAVAASLSIYKLQHLL
jgi:hypothetical protein